MNVNAVALALPRIGVTNVGEVDKTVFPLPVDVVTPVPPFTTGNAVPLKEIANVPLVVIGLPETDKNAGTVAATLVTVPLLSVGNVCNAPVPSMYCEPRPTPVIASVPEDVIGEPVTLNAEGTVNATDVTVPT